jgi:hypothetical protein
MYEEHFHLLPKSLQDSEEERLRAVQHTLNHAHDGWQAMNEVVARLFTPTYQIDEMSFIFNDPTSLMGFVRQAVRVEGYTLFNSATDAVTTTPLRSSYEVAYWFLATPFPYRLELMVAGKGSPLHDQYAATLAKTAHYEMAACSVHASFKCDDEAQYADAVHRLRTNEMEMVQGCLSTYGRFSYWQEANGSPDAPFPNWFLKPRVNLRDSRDPGEAGEEAMETRAAGRE